MATQESTPLEIGLGRKVVMHFTLSLEDGTVAETTREDNDPLSFVFGDGTLTQGLEAAIVGLKTGAKQTLQIEPGLVFGSPDPAKVHDLPRDSFEQGFDDRLRDGSGEKKMSLAPGLVVSFETPKGEQVMGTLLEVGDEQVTVDFNHPLASRTLWFEVEILSVTREEKH